MLNSSLKILQFIIRKIFRPVFLLIRDLWKESKLGFFGGVVVVAFLLIAIFADIVAPYPSREIHLADKLSPPSVQYLMGTDQLGRDVLSRIIFGARISLYVGLGAAAVAVVIAAVIGTSSPYIGGAFDLIIQRFVDAYLAFPSLLLMMAVVAALGQGVWQLIVIMGVGSGIGWSRTFRSQVYAIKENTYIEVAKVIGANTSHTLIRHVIPNITPIILVAFSLTMGGSILGEAGLSFLGIGIPPPNPTWGQMLSLEGRDYMFLAPWLAIWPGVALGIVVFGINMFGDSLRDHFDPRLKGGLGGINAANKKQADKQYKRYQAKLGKEG